MAVITALLMKLKPFSPIAEVAAQVAWQASSGLSDRAKAFLQVRQRPK